MKTILITGINGFLGSSLAKAFINKFKIIGLESSLNNLYRIKDYNFKVYTSKNGISDKIFTEQKIDIIIHTSTLYGRNKENNLEMISSNLSFPLELIEKAILNKNILFVNADTVLGKFTNSYALSKAHFREWLILYQNDLKIINLRLEHFYGPGSSNSNFISQMITRLKCNESVIDLSKGNQKRDFIYIDDVISAFLFIFKILPKIKANYSDFHINTNHLITIKELVQHIKTITKSNSVLNFGAIPLQNPSSNKIIKELPSLQSLGWQPKIQIKEGIQKTIFCY